MRHSFARGKAASLTIVALCEVAAMTLWFSATAILPALVLLYELPPFQQALFTSAVQAGFVCGTLVSAILGLADRLDPRHFFSVSALIAALSSLPILYFDPASWTVIVLRFVTGLCMAGIYPVGIRIVASWATRDTGLLVGILVGALTLGSASPHLVNALGFVDWRTTLIVCALAALASALLIHAAGYGPKLGRAPSFNPAATLAAWRNRSLRLANLGYLGHMWELYAMWAWIGIFLQASLAADSSDSEGIRNARIATFTTIGIGGAIGCLAGGLLADRLGRTTVTMAAMAVSGTCALMVGLLHYGPEWALLLVCFIWGVAVIADSAQFSASIVELSDQDITGTMLTVQTCLGFLLTMVTIHLMPWLIDWLGWSWAFAPLALGPFLGMWAMARLRAAPEAGRLAGGKR